MNKPRYVAALYTEGNPPATPFNDINRSLSAARTLRILKELLSDPRPHTTEELAQTIGITLQQTQRFINAGIEAEVISPAGPGYVPNSATFRKLQTKFLLRVGEARLALDRIEKVNRIDDNE